LLLMSCVMMNTGAQTFTGKVLDEQHKPIDAVNVMLTDSMGKVCAFVFTSRDGMFSISSPHVSGAAKSPPTNISFSAVGRERRTLPLDQFRNNQTVTLKSESFVLKEVVVRPDKITSKGDTLTYNVLSFKQGQDRTISDVLKKMPGIEVSSSGQISYEGRAINKFYIEGLDLMGNKYVQASENLPADKVKSVQVMENHQPIASLRGVQFSDQAALNLVLSDAAKNAWIGVLDAGAGVQLGADYDALYDGRIMGMTFGRRQQNVSMYKCNNTGKDIAREIKYVGASSRNNLKDGLLSNLSTMAPELDEGRTRFNTSHSVTTNHLVSSSKENSFRVQLDYLWNRNDVQLDRETEYIDLGNMLFTESTSSRSVNHRLKGDIDYKVNNEKLYLDNQLQAYMDFDQSSGTTVLNGVATRQCVRPRRRMLSDNFDIDKVLHNGTILNFTSQNSYNYQPGRLLTLKGFDEDLTYSCLETNNVLSFRHRMKRFTIKYEVGMNAQSESLNVEYSQTKMRETSSRVDFFITPSVNMEKNDVKLSAALKADWLVGHRFALLPLLSFLYEASATTKLTANYSYTQSPSTLTSLFTIPVFTSYRSAFVHSGEMEYNGRHTCRVAINYKQPVKGNFLTLSAQMVKKVDVPLYRSVYADSVYMRMPASEHKSENAYSLSLYAAKSLYWWKTLVAFSAMQTWSDFYVMLASVPSQCQMSTSTMSLRLSMSPARPLSFEWDSRLTSSNQKSRDGVGIDAERLTWFSHSMKIFCFPADDWEIGLTNELYHSNDNSVSTNYFADLLVSYRRKRYELKLTCSNIFNNRKYERRLLTSETRTYSVYALRPREILMSVSLDL